MFANQIFGIVFLAALMYVVSSEVHSALHAVHYAVKQGGGWRVGMARYVWASLLFHEMAQREQGNNPAYRASSVVGVFGAAAALMAVAGAGFYLASGAAVLAAVSYGAVAFGRAFVAQRSMVSQEISAWASAAA